MVGVYKNLICYTKTLAKQTPQNVIYFIKLVATTCKGCAFK